MARTFSSYTPSEDEIFDWLWRNFDATEPPKSDPCRELNINIPVSAERARQGGTLRLAIPARRECPTCRGQGRVGVYECWRCGGEGALSGDVSINLCLPPHSAQSQAVHVPLARPWFSNMRITVHFKATCQDDALPIG
jgi:molecular chaperone DnaJ